MADQAGFAEVNGAKLYYEVTGQGHPLVLIHAGIADHRMWDDQMPVFAGRYRVIRYDVRGFGRSSLPPTPFSMREDLLRLLEYLRVEEAHVMGVSMGGGIAIDFTLDHPEMVSALIPVAAGLSGGKRPPEALYKQWEEIQAAQAAGDPMRANELVVRMWVDGPQRTPEQVDQRVRERVKQMLRDIDQDQQDKPKAQPLEPPAAARLAEIHVPTLLIVGDLDVPHVLETMDVLAAGIPGARKVTIPGTAHLPNMEQPAFFNQTVLDFLSIVNAG